MLLTNNLRFNETMKTQKLNDLVFNDELHTEILNQQQK